MGKRQKSLLTRRDFLKMAGYLRDDVIASMSWMTWD